MSEPATLLLRLAGPMQSWGSGSHFTRRSTNAEPTKSGVVGLLAAAEGRRRQDPIEDLGVLRLGVRVDRPGHLMVDFQTAMRRVPVRGGGVKDVVMPLSRRHYLADAVFLVAVEGPSALIDALHDAVRRPRFALALGRRSCPPAGRLVEGVESGRMEDLLATHSWLGELPQSRRRREDSPQRLLVVRDAAPDDDPASLEREHDVPVSFDPQHRRFSWRWVRREWIDNPAVASDEAFVHDPFSEVG